MNNNTPMYVQRKIILRNSLNLGADRFEIHKNDRWVKKSRES